MSFIEGINEGISKNQLEGAVLDIERSLNKELAGLRVDKRQLEGKTIKSAHNEWDEIILIFDDGTYFMAEAENDTYDGLSLSLSIMNIYDAHKHGLLSDEKHQELEDAKKAARVVDDEKEGVVSLNNAIALLGADTVKKLVNVQE